MRRLTEKAYVYCTVSDTDHILCLFLVPLLSNGSKLLLIIIQDDQAASGDLLDLSIPPQQQQQPPPSKQPPADTSQAKPSAKPSATTDLEAELDLDIENMKLDDNIDTSVSKLLQYSIR